MSGHLYSLPVDCVNLLFENLGVLSRLVVAHSFRSSSLIERAKRDVFRVKYGEFTLNEKNSPLDEVIERVRISVTHLPNAIALRVENDLLVFKFKGELCRGELSLHEIDQIYKRVKNILEGINNYASDFSPPTTLKEQRNIKRRRFRLQQLFNHYVRLYKETAAHHKFPAAFAAAFRLIDCPPVKIGCCGNYLIYGSFLCDRRYEFYIRENGSLKCSFIFKLGIRELNCFLPRLVQVQECHLVMMKVVAAVFNREKQELLSLYHYINFLPLLYEVGLSKFSLSSESALKHAQRQGKHPYEVLHFTPSAQENVRMTPLNKHSMDPQMIDRMRSCCEEVIFNSDSDSTLFDYT